MCIRDRNETVRFAFQHMDMFSQMPLSARIAYINKNRYAISEGVPQYNSELEYLDKGYWVKPFTRFEKINLNHGPVSYTHLDVYKRQGSCC